MMRLFTGTLILGLLSVSAQAAPPPDTRSAARHYADGAAAFERGDFRAAITAFEAAHDSVPHPANLANIARCYERLGDGASCVQLWGEYLDLFRTTHAGKDPSDAADVRVSIRRCELLASPRLMIDSDPPGATVRLDDSEASVGSTPLELTLAVGPHRLRLDKPGYEPFYDRVEVRGGAQRIRVRLEQVSRAGRVLVKVNVRGASVYVDGRAIGLTPYNDPVSLDPGRHRVEVKKHRYADATREVDVVTGQTHGVELALVRRDGSPPPEDDLLDPPSPVASASGPAEPRTPTSVPAPSVTWPTIDVPPPRVPGFEKDVALIITIENYAALPGVRGAEANGLAWSRWFAGTRGLRADRIAWLRDGEATPTEILAKAAELSAMADSGSTLWVVFIGHGAPAEDGRDGVLIGWAAQQRARELYSQSIRQSQLIAALGNGRRGDVTMIVDACFSGRGMSGESLAAGLQPVLLASRPPSAEHVTVLTAGSSDQFAGPLPGAARPAFSYLLLGALRGWADDATYGNADGKVTLGEALDFTRVALQATLTGRSQRPEGWGTLTRSPGIRATEPAPDLAAIRETIR